MGSFGHFWPNGAEFGFNGAHFYLAENGVFKNFQGRGAEFHLSLAIFDDPDRAETRRLRP